MRGIFRKYAARSIFAIAFAVFLYTPSVASAGTITLGTAQSFAVMGFSTVTDTGSTTLNGDLGLWSGTSITGLADITFAAGTVHQTDPVVQQAQADATSAYLAQSSLSYTSDLSGQDLGTIGTLTPGVYRFSTSAQLTGTLTLNALGNPNALFVFEIGSTLTTAAGSGVSVIDGGAGTGVYWDVGSSATLGAGTAFAGNLLANTSITLNNSATILCGRALALTGAVTMDTNTISDTCSAGGDLGSGRSDFGSLGFSGGSGGTQAVPEPKTIPLLCLGLLALALARQRHPGNSAS